MIDDATDLRRRLLRWYDAHRRVLPWRATADRTVTPWTVLVSEAMLQQTQVATVIPYFTRFIDRFPTPVALAEADEQDVLKLWQGLGYYRRARNLQACARAIVERHHGNVPATLDALLALPGIGRYTAGAIGSIAFGLRVPILDGNVQRVLCRWLAIEDDPRTPAVQKRLWSIAEALVPRSRPGDFNTAMMELGATVCTPRSPACLMCPVRQHCRAATLGLQNRIPPAKVRAELKLHHRRVWCIRNARGELLMTQRPTTGRWAGLWEFVTTDADALCPVDVEATTPLCVVRHALTHRRYEFTAVTCRYVRGKSSKQHWRTLEDLPPMSKPQLAIAAALRDGNPVGRG